MTKYNSRVCFDDTAEVLIKGKIGGREVEYQGHINELTCSVDDGIGSNEYSWRGTTWNKETTTYSFEFAQVDGKAITAKIGRKPVIYTARTHFIGQDVANDIDRAAYECGAPDGSDYKIDRKEKYVEFTWTDEIV